MTKVEVRDMLLESMRKLAASRDELNAMESRMQVVRTQIEDVGQQLKELYMLLMDR